MQNQNSKVQPTSESLPIGNAVLAAGYCPQCGHETVVENENWFGSSVKIERCDGLIEIDSDKPLVACLWSQELE